MHNALLHKRKTASSAPGAPNLLERLLPDRYPQANFFIVDNADAVLDGLLPSMEHSFYAFSEKPDTAIPRYEHEGKWSEVVLSVKGQPTLYDKNTLHLRRVSDHAQAEPERVR
ncbi:hypothetical protein HKX23_16565 [Sulfitobacter sp. KE29]|nr:hypothetical protein [Sulfitobacter sp. KE29]